MLADFENVISERNPVMRIVPQADRRKDRRRSFEGRDLVVQQVNAKSSRLSKLGSLLDMSTSGVRFRTTNTKLSVGDMVQIRLALPDSEGIRPFMAREGKPAPTAEWTGWVSITRIVERLDSTREIAGAMMGLDETDLGMLGLYLSTQPLAA